MVRCKRSKNVRSKLGIQWTRKNVPPCKVSWLIHVEVNASSSSSIFKLRLCRLTATGLLFLHLLISSSTFITFILIILVAYSLFFTLAIPHNYPLPRYLLFSKSFLALIKFVICLTIWPFTIITIFPIKFCIPYTASRLQFIFLLLSVFNSTYVQIGNCVVMQRKIT